MERDIRRLLWVAILVSLTANYAQALKCVPEIYSKGETTGEIYFGSFSARGNPINVDRESFDGLKSQTYAKDKNHVYLFGKIIPSANPETYELLTSKGFLFIKDDKHLYFRNNAVIHDGDLATIQVFDEHFSRDKNALYFSGYRVPKINPDTFEAISWKPDIPEYEVYWKHGCTPYNKRYINEATDGKHKLSHEELMKKYGPWRVVK